MDVNDVGFILVPPYIQLYVDAVNIDIMDLRHVLRITDAGVKTVSEVDVLKRTLNELSPVDYNAFINLNKIFHERYNHKYVGINERYNSELKLNNDVQRCFYNEKQSSRMLEKSKNGYRKIPVKTDGKFYFFILESEDMENLVNGDITDIELNILAYMVDLPKNSHTSELALKIII